MASPTIKCPYCGGGMVAGDAFIRGTFWGFLIVGLSHQHLWFRSGERKELVLASGDRCGGHRCAECGAVSVYSLNRPWKH